MVEQVTLLCQRMAVGTHPNLSCQRVRPRQLWSCRSKFLGCEYQSLQTFRTSKAAREDLATEIMSDLAMAQQGEGPFLMGVSATGGLYWRDHLKYKRSRRGTDATSVLTAFCSRSRLPLSLSFQSTRASAARRTLPRYRAWAIVGNRKELTSWSSWCSTKKAARQEA
ncbi:hypothetical protein M427DRAFT_157093 [Gonapodya prolifera JEL478]|uniref:Uncharacterized protein n=1 Tax=Gonapodya prolifera (strain JEL478) TaxID=1344416 RepID=A0A139A8H0_GONPJ|nr:hypothetical protein M427DRAFT_157093 [Gonapodya prolifera JEL478]|eukprot:KXS12683.1 hypothetical protein M427DRAFT_157093 [Gonapodya prolifera JEL478]